ncbi:dihydrolipoamide acetyltransferase family protein [Pseudarthrobacter raffinosi]|uniref:dihydrolipoamide acetyltransferase family protein n=1 Tax=Pseudarthrobacter raffinosi TaxID=2953651 RepID=UPI00208E805C|nr:MULTISPECIES: dihydrolipoamide acetyltransferase family protein [unclassified Pseudarthrobacter]MCO4239697.1 2-oxo acid dehydrogenase subunit E2 [Pseudarthrobacter sp. MDT3-28]MCO4250144.1 2-oxo acid dehydrogenase subunit E2 [Pseudarthrobacter sp. MDT3-9]MCO4265276.1 2-oxo acid dehydrogenase subunit E2 [Pseudarthrobacter sp. MDT3-26]
MGEFLMPSLGADMEHGKLVEWLVKPGDYVRRGDLVAVVDTDKTIMDVESFQEGVVADLLVDIGETVPVGTPLARITQTPAETGPPAHEGPPARATAKAAVSKTAVPKAAAPEAPETAAPKEAAPIAPPVRHLAHRLGVDTAKIHGTGKGGVITRADVEHAVAARPGSRVRSSPRARRLAAELGVELATISGTGPQSAVTEADVHRAAGSHAEALVPEVSSPALHAPPKGAPEEPVTGKTSEARERLASLRRAIGALMSRSKKTIPHYYLSTTLDLRAAVDWMQSVNAQRPVAARLVPSALLLKAAALAARDVPEVNGFYGDSGFRPSASVHLGVAVALRQGGLVAPAIHDADTLPVEVLMEQLRDLVSRARAGRLQRAEMADPTITVTNLGDLGVESVYGVIYPPQVAMVGFGRVMEQPWAQNGMLGVRHAVIATLSADHRVSDGLRGGRYLARIEELLQKPEEL